MVNKLYILRKASNGTEMVLKGKVTVGRDPECDLKLAEGKPSRIHARLDIADGMVFVEDLNSRNGTFVNDKKIDPNTRVWLKSNDRLRFDIEKFEFRIESDDPRSDQTEQRLNQPDLVVEPGPKQLAPAWVENPKKGGNETQYMRPEQVRQERKRLQDARAVEQAFGDVESPQLVVLGGPRIELRATRAGQKEWTVGSQGDREILLKREGVSALHARIINEGSRWRVVDELSVNGTFVNGQRTNNRYLASSDRITFGPVECIFQLPKGGGGGPGTRFSRWKTIAISVGILLLIIVIAYAVRILMPIK